MTSVEREARRRAVTIATVAGVLFIASYVGGCIAAYSAGRAECREAAP